MANPFVHVELGVESPEESKAFYSKLFAWEFDVMPSPVGDYTTIKVGEGVGGGIFKKSMPEVPRSEEHTSELQSQR